MDQWWWFEYLQVFLSEIEYDRLPKDLVELKEFIKLQELTDGIEYKYDASTGKIKIVNSPR